MEIRIAKKEETEEVLNTVTKAFGGDKGAETAGLVKDLLNDSTAEPYYSIIAVNDQGIIGHILFTKVNILPAKKTSASILAPLAVVPEYQSKGIGGELIKEGLKILKENGVEIVFVLGHPGYYPRLGFKPAGLRVFEAPYPIEDKNSDAWMVQELKDGILANLSGKVKCADALDDQKYWVE